jgi:NADH-quinone oxidoreductase subunit N
VIPIELESARLENTLAHDLLRFAPELALVAGILAVLSLKLFRFGERIHAVTLALPVVVAAFGVAVSDWMSTDIFRGLLRLDGFANFFRAFVLLTVACALALARITRRPDAADSADYVALVLGGALGMMMMASANHLLIVFLALEMASLPGYVLVGFRKSNARASEGSLKYAVYGAAATGVLLYGFSLLAGRFGTASIPELATRIAVSHSHGSFDFPLASALLLVLVGLGYKLAAVPFQFWMPDAFESAGAEVAAILAVASKAAALGLVVRIAMNFTALVPNAVAPREAASVALGVLAVASVTFGNLAALAQTNIQRLLAFSTIAHAGIMLMAVACLNNSGNTALLYYLVGYLPATFGAFAVAALLSGPTGSPSIDNFRGLLRRSPSVGVPAAIAFFGLLGLPPLAGFAGKFQVFASLYRNGIESSSQPWMADFYWFLLAVGVLNTVIAAGYYLLVLKAIALDEPSEDDASRVVPGGLAARIFLAFTALAALAIGLAWDPILDFLQLAAHGLDR